ncbi:peptide/nickel transport system substrate-binding protein [Streptosporangium album]|uniref:Peptide/nickel transport system substrate-binding protein n=1 Tax=Streptosporangium album TaxID=47479 RepID=A0A7W7RUV8_9ACTN|nr:ABC transporter substrate-binding protein [Streptosporangium album]MBB4938658.1 peptide/nickel transport system substrate-binding protein [Streptosporangium album]
MAAMEGMGRRQFLTLLGAGVAGVSLPALVSGCAPGGPGTGSASGGNRPLSAAFYQAINDLDPHGASAVDEASLLANRQIYDTLVTRDGDKLVPGLATSWRQPDEKTWEFTLRDDVTFHDGTELTSADVKASLERLATSVGPQKPLWSALDAIEAPDRHTVRLTTKDPLGTLLVNLTLAFVLPAAHLGGAGFFRRPIGSGPFAVESFTPSSQLLLKPAANYWGGASKLPGLRLPYIPEASTRMTSLQNGEVDVTWIIPPDELKRLNGVNGVRVESKPGVNYFLAWFNCGRKPFSDVRVRRALSHALDVKSIVSNLYGDAATVMDAPIPSAVFGHASQQPYEYDPELARRELAEAGYSSGIRTSMMWFKDTGPLATELAQSIISAWAKVGVTVEPQQIEKAAWIKRLTALDWDIELQVNTVTTGDADYTLGRLYTSDANRMGYSNKKLDGILAEARSTSDQDRRGSLYGQACEIIWRDAVGVFPAALSSTYGLRSTVQGFVPAANSQPEFRAVSTAR